MLKVAVLRVVAVIITPEMVVVVTRCLLDILAVLRLSVAGEECDAGSISRDNRWSYVMEVWVCCLNLRSAIVLTYANDLRRAKSRHPTGQGSEVLVLKIRTRK